MPEALGPHLRRLFPTVLLALSLLTCNKPPAEPITFARTYGGAESDVGYSVQQTMDGGYIIAGTRKDTVGQDQNDVYLIRTNADGDTLWTRTFGGPYDDEGYSVQQTADSGFIVAGARSDGICGPGVCLIRTDANGDTVWTRTLLDGAYPERGNSVQQTADGGFIVAGYTGSIGAGWDDVLLVRTDASGGTLWTRTFGGPDADEGHSVQQTSDGGFIIAGWTTSLGAGGADVYLIKTDSLGNVAP